MGIRWYGWEISREELRRAESDPWPVIRAADARSYDPDWGVIGMDKAWSGMQRLFSDPSESGHFQPRPAFGLVAGNVTYPDGACGEYLPYIGLLDEDSVRQIAQDLQTVSDADLRADAEAWEPCGYPSELSHFVPIAREFTADAASRGHCLIYVIR